MGRHVHLGHRRTRIVNPDRVFVDAVSYGSWPRWDALRGAVHAVFPSAAYVALEEGGMVVVHDVRHGHTPASVLIPSPERVTARLRRAQHVVVAGGALHAGPVTIDLRPAARWCLPPRHPVDLAELHRRWMTAPTTSMLLVDAAAHERIGDRAEALEHALRHEDDDGLARAARALVGFGPGLTPSGDDVLVGLVTVLHRSWAAGAAGGALVRRLQAAVPPLLGRTTPISAHHLALALDGHAGEHLVALVDELLDHGTPQPSTVARVRATGATSGADAIVGVLAGTRLVQAELLEAVA
jgi:hypothetical protein